MNDCECQTSNLVVPAYRGSGINRLNKQKAKRRERERERER